MFLSRILAGQKAKRFITKGESRYRVSNYRMALKRIYPNANVDHSIWDQKKGHFFRNMEFKKMGKMSNNVTDWR